MAEHTDNNPHEAARRAIKAMKLIAAVGGYSARHKLDAAEVAQHADLRDRLLFARIAQVTDPSNETWALVVESIVGAKKVLATFPGCGE